MILFTDRSFIVLWIRISWKRALANSSLTRKQFALGWDAFSSQIKDITKYIKQWIYRCIEIIIISKGITRINNFKWHWYSSDMFPKWFPPIFLYTFLMQIVTALKIDILHFVCSLEVNMHTLKNEKVRWCFSLRYSFLLLQIEVIRIFS